MAVSSKYTQDVLSVQIVSFTFSFKWFLFFYFWAVIVLSYSTDQKKPNRERERVQNGYRTGTRTREWNRYRTGTERIQNGYRTDIERILNGYGTVTKEKSVLYQRTRSSEHMLVSYAIRVLTRDLKMIQF